MKYFITIVFILFLPSCGVTGLGGFQQVAEGLQIQSEENGNQEAGCFEAEYTGTWTKSRVSYRKVVIPPDWPEEVDIPTC